MLDDDKAMPLTSTHERFQAVQDLPLMYMRTKGIDPQSLQDVPQDLEYPADYKYEMQMSVLVKINGYFSKIMLVHM